jgi:hypothetical protein
LSASYTDDSVVVLKRRSPLARRIAAWLGIAAAPAFAVMAVITGLPGGDRMAMTCGVEASSLAGMVPMYLLMSVFHLTPWLELIGDRFSRKSSRQTV